MRSSYVPFLVKMGDAIRRELPAEPLVVRLLQQQKKKKNAVSRKKAKCCIDQVAGQGVSYIIIYILLYT